ncbi:MAG: hypothetical protein GKS04_00395 [Candidatus Mycalebacterium zealandia]|nr:MAG: hypothetical protein GKS04_00395 [Candidatus Mycalebacterium zealandia]
MMIYELIDSIPGGGEYWSEYINFYEKFWDRPASPRSTWWGKEYDEFRNLLASNLGIETGEIKDCFFIKENERYFVCRIDEPSSFNIISCENFIPFEWLAAFDEEKRDFFYTHAGFGAVHHDSIFYTENIGDAMKRIEEAESVCGKTGDRISEYPEFEKIKNLAVKLREMNSWLRGFDEKGKIFLNYGEICSFITQDSMKNENSVGDLKRIIKGIEKGNYEKAESDLRFLNAKWTEITGAIERSG